MPSTYTAATIGPIKETLDAARKTRELWGASYLFSYIIKKIVIKLKENVTVLLPDFEKKEDYENNLGAGLFPDRIYVEGTFDISNVYEKVIEELSVVIAAHINQDSKSVVVYLKKYYRFISVHFNCEPDENIIEKGSHLLDSKEQQSQFIPVDEYVDNDNPLFQFLYLVNGSFLFTDGFDETEKRFPSLIEIATKKFSIIHPQKYRKLEIEVKKTQEKFQSLKDEKNNQKDNDIGDFAEELFGDELRQSHRYFAIVLADGDHIGKMVAKVGTRVDTVQEFSKKLLLFSKNATEMVVKYGGSPVYMGGDDLFFFAPLTYQVNQKPTSILDLIKELENEFKKSIVTYAEKELKIEKIEKPSLSFGITFSYYKFPLYEARTMVENALYSEIKNANKRNAVNIKFRKHSGKTFRLFVAKDDPVLWNATIEFVNANLYTDAGFLNSFTHKLRYQDEVLFKSIATDNEKLEQFFKNNFNENYRQQESFYKALQQYILILKQHNQDADYLYPVLRFIHFLRS